MGFLKDRPKASMMDALHRFIAPARLQGSDTAANQNQKMMILKFCMDIAANATTCYPYGSHDRLDASEKASFLKVLKSLEIDPGRTF